MQDPHTKTKEELFKELNSTEEGLSAKHAEKKLKELGQNEIKEKKKKSQILIFLKQFNSPLIFILFAAAIISYLVDHLVDTYVILAIVLVNAIIGFVQERKAERAINALKKNTSFICQSLSR